MRKVLAIMFMILCGFAFVGSGIVLLSGCSSSQSETGGVGRILPKMRQLKLQVMKRKMKIVLTIATKIKKMKK